MIYFVTGASGFIGKRLVRTLLARPKTTVHFLMRRPTPERVGRLLAFWGVDASRAIPVEGDLTKPALGIDEAETKKLAGKVTHVFHLAAIYDLEADPEAEMVANIEGTRNAVRFAEAIRAKHFHHVSSIAAAGMYDGVFREDMFEEATGLDHPYFASKHQAEKVVRGECKVPWRIYRPGIVVGDSMTGEIDKIDGPYYFFKLIQKLRRMLPPWMPTIGIEGGRINIVPVDFVVAALDHIAHLDGHDGGCFHLTDPEPRRVGDVLAIFASAAHAPRMAARVNAALFGFVPQALIRPLMALTPVRRIQKTVMKELGLPPDIFRFVNYPTRFDAREAQRLLEPAGIRVPHIEDYAWRLWDYWERHLDPELFIDRSLKGRVAGRVVVVTGGSAGIGKATAFKLAGAGAKTVIVARDTEKLEAARQEAAAQGLTVLTYSADVTDAEQCADLVRRLHEDHGGVDILVNNAGRSIRRGIEGSYDRFHDFERTMQVNYFGALRLTLGLLPKMTEKRHGHIVNISSIGVLTNAPRFSAYVASKAALDAWTRCAASEFLDRGVEFTTINMPLVRTEMIAPTKFYRHVPTLSPEEAADLVVQAIVMKPARVATQLGIFGQVIYAVSPKLAQAIMNTTFRMFPDSDAARNAKPGEEMPTADQITVTQIMRGLHL
ncbi:SDR family oxidoreductase [Pinisolibacter sp.]|uniref:SDR family oxidoreductase n=1 Tax=Pinisolibacter sp. TaxID=2172024 RepID=UPI002FDE038E